MSDSFEQDWDKLGSLEHVTKEELQRGVEIRNEAQRIEEQKNRISSHMKPVGKGKKPHHKYPSNYTPPKRRLRTNRKSS